MAKQNKSGVPSTPFFYLRDFGETQHYTGRSPKWIKLSLDLLNDNAFIGLSISARHHFFCLLLIASMRDNVIPMDFKYLKKMMRSMMNLS